MDDRYARTIASAILVTLMGAGIVVGLSNKCETLAQNDCLTVWGLAVSAIMGGIILAEAIVIYRLNRYEQQIATASETEAKRQLPGRYVWLRSIIRLSLATLLLGLPIIIQSAFAATGAGLLIGFGLDFFVRGIFDRLPPKF
jgi:hypothetical protein